jgi:phytoene dehydrogenase-like protein
VVVGSGPNGLSAAVELGRHGLSVLVLEGEDEIGGGTRTAELTLPGFAHDVCSGAHPLGSVSPFLSALPLGDYGLEWVRGSASVAHPLDGEPAVIVRRSLTETAQGLGADATAYRTLLGPLAGSPQRLIDEVLRPLLHVPRHPLLLVRFGVPALAPAALLARTVFRGRRARAMFAGCAAHSILRFDAPISSAAGLVLLTIAHAGNWPVARGGSAAITRALAAYLESLGGRIETGRRVASLRDIPPSRIVLFDTSPAQLADIAAQALPHGFTQRLRKFRYGPGVFKLDWALDGPIPWTDPRCLDASTVHVGGTCEEIAGAERAVWRGEHPQRPFVLIVQQSQFDSSRAPAGKHTGYAYCHVPTGSSADLTDAVERQVERFAPGFRERILARHAMRPADLERHNPNCIGGAIGGGVMDAAQLLMRPAPRLDPYSTRNPRLYLCSASTPPGGGVHGMCGYWAARSALRRLGR